MGLVNVSLLTGACEEVRLLPSCRDCEIEALFFLLIAFQKDGSQVPEKDILGCRRLGLKGSEKNKFKCSKKRDFRNL